MQDVLELFSLAAVGIMCNHTSLSLKQQTSAEPGSRPGARDQPDAVQPASRPMLCRAHVPSRHGDEVGIRGSQHERAEHSKKEPGPGQEVEPR